MRRHLLLPRRPQGATAHLLAVLLFVMTITAAAGLAVWNGNRMVADAVDARSTVQLPGGIERTDELATFLSGRGDVAAAVAVDPAEVRATLETWMGPAAREAELPLPALVGAVGVDPSVIAPAGAPIASGAVAAVWLVLVVVASASRFLTRDIT